MKEVIEVRVSRVEEAILAHLRLGNLAGELLINTRVSRGSARVPIV